MFPKDTCAVCERACVCVCDTLLGVLVSGLWYATHIVCFCVLMYNRSGKKQKNSFQCSQKLHPNHPMIGTCSSPHSIKDTKHCVGNFRLLKSNDIDRLQNGFQAFLKGRVCTMLSDGLLQNLLQSGMSYSIGILAHSGTLLSRVCFGSTTTLRRTKVG